MDKVLIQDQHKINSKNERKMYLNNTTVFPGQIFKISFQLNSLKNVLTKMWRGSGTI